MKIFLVHRNLERVGNLLRKEETLSRFYTGFMIYISSGTYTGYMCAVEHAGFECGDSGAQSMK